VHRDIKFENLLVDNKGRLILCDFGGSYNMNIKKRKDEIIITTPLYSPP
jgi:serine/threonine protein kinase